MEKRQKKPNLSPKIIKLREKRYLFNSFSFYSFFAIIMAILGTLGIAFLVSFNSTEKSQCFEHQLSISENISQTIKPLDINQPNCYYFFVEKEQIINIKTNKKIKLVDSLKNSKL